MPRGTLNKGTFLSGLRPCCLVNEKPSLTGPRAPFERAGYRSSWINFSSPIIIKHELLMHARSSGHMRRRRWVVLRCFVGVTRSWRNGRPLGSRPGPHRSIASSFFSFFFLFWFFFLFLTPSQHLVLSWLFTRCFVFATFSFHEKFIQKNFLKNV